MLNKVKNGLYAISSMYSLRGSDSFVILVRAVVMVGRIVRPATGRTSLRIYPRRRATGLLFAMPFRSGEVKTPYSCQFARS
jgi:hypothetical protein